MEQCISYEDYRLSTLDEHYSGRRIEAIEAMQANMTEDEFIGYLKGNIMKYICRIGRKDDPKQEVEKVVVYADWLKKVLNGEIINPKDKS